MATFFSRPDLSDIQFKQLADSELHLSGTTYFMKVGGLQVADENATKIPIVATGATDGYVLTYLDGQISLQPGGGSCTGDLHFPQGLNQVTRFKQDPQYNVNVSACTVTTFLEKYFFPAVEPSSSLSASNSSRQFGDAGGGTLSYSVTRETNPLCAIGIDTNADGSLDQFPVTGPVTGSCSGSYAYSYPGSCPSPASGTSQTSASYGLCASTTADEVTCSTTSVTWRNKKYYFQSTTQYTSADESTLETIANGLSGSQAQLTTSKSANLNLTFSNEFFYYMYPTSFGQPSFKINGLPNNAWGNESTGTLFKIDFTNSNGYLNQYYVARSDSRITGAYSIEIT